MQLYEIEVEFLKVLLLGIFFGYWINRLISGTQRSTHLREIKQYKYLSLNKTQKLKEKKP